MTSGASEVPALEAERLGKTYTPDGQDVVAVREVDVKVERGDLVAIMGPSGCGKSTLLHLLGGLARPTTGRALVDGVDLAGMTDRELAEVRRTKVGFVFQAFNLVPVLSAEENVALPALIAGRPRSWAAGRAAELLEAVGLHGRNAQRPSQLSGGEQQRVAIARALVMDPSVLLADEPTGNLDSRSGRDIVHLLLGLHQRGQTIVLVTHDVKVAGVAERLLVMRDGQLEERLRSAAPSGGPSDTIERLVDIDDPAELPW